MFLCTGSLFKKSLKGVCSARRNKFASKRTLDYFRKKYPEYANNWLVSQIAETETLTKSCCAVVIYHQFLYLVISIFAKFNQVFFFDTNSIFLLTGHAHIKLGNNASE